MPQLQQLDNTTEPDENTRVQDGEGISFFDDDDDYNGRTKCRFWAWSTWPKRVRMTVYCLVSLLVIILVCVAIVGTKGDEVQKAWDSVTLGSPEPLYRIPQAVRDSIDEIRSDFDRIIDHAIEGPGKGTAWQRAADICDQFGHRHVGEQGLEDAIDDMASMLSQDSLQNVRFEQMQVPKWIRGEESLHLVEPLAGGKQRALSMLGMGLSMGTAPGGIEAEVLVVNDVGELGRKAALAKGRIVIFHFEFTSYGSVRPYRSHGPSFAAKLGAVAAGISSLASFSLASPHTGSISYRTGTLRRENAASWGGPGPELPDVLLGNYTDVPHIPGFSLSTEDANMLERMHRKGLKMKLRLEMGAKHEGTAETRNVVAEIVGSEKPEEFILIGGHFDSWDIGCGAQDDLAASIVQTKVMATIQQLNLKPRRSIRLVLFTAEEIGSLGGHHHMQEHAAQLDKLSAIFDLDTGIFHWLGMGITGDEQTIDTLRYVATSLDRIGAGKVQRSRWRATSNVYMAPADIPVIGDPIQLGINAIRPEYYEDGKHSMPKAFQGNYWFYHHTHADRIETVDSAQMDRAVAIATVYTYAVAMLPDLLTRGPWELGTEGGEGRCDAEATRDLPLFVTCGGVSGGDRSSDSTGTQLTAWVRGSEPAIQ